MSVLEGRGLLACPHCRSQLGIEPDVARCPSGHSFDVARHGYLNLALGAEPANADTPAMLRARARVHGRGLFDGVAAAVVDALPYDLETVVEVGAGNGFHLAQALDERPDARGVAVDVSKAAARTAAGAHSRAASVVADVWKGLPLLDHRVDAVLCVFAPRNVAEFARILRPDGQLVVATPGPGHLSQLRDKYQLLAIGADKHERLIGSASEFFNLKRSFHTKQQIHASREVVADLIAMGPNAFHGEPRETSDERVTIDVQVTTFQPL